MQVIILYSEVSQPAKADEEDTLIQAQAVAEALQEAGHEASQKAFAPACLQELRKLPGDAAVFNLVESVKGGGNLVYLPPAMLEAAGVRYTGCSAQALLISTDKVLAKRIMLGAGIRTPGWVAGRERQAEPGMRYVIKPRAEDASVGLDEDGVVYCESHQQIAAEIERRAELLGLEFMAEQYIEGREFNISMLGPRENPVVLPSAEMLFDGYPEGKPRIVGYTAKWDPQSFEYRHTNRAFGTLEAGDRLLDERLRQTALRCWEVFGLNGYARVDLRVDQNGEPWVLEINANPGIAPDAGFTAAAAEAGYSYAEMVERILHCSSVGHASCGPAFSRN